jgi:hypothetical protein
MHKTVPLITILIFVLSSSQFLSVCSAIPQPSTPDFTLKLIDSSHDIPATSTTDPYTGKNVITEGSHVDARTIEIRIQNEPFTPFTITEGTANWTVGFCYNIRWKGHYEQDWYEIYSPTKGMLSREEGSETIYSNQGKYSSIDGLTLNSQGIYKTFPIGAEIDFQVEAMIGYIHRVVDDGMNPWVFTGETSGWSSTQTVTIGDTTRTASPASSQSSISPITNPTGNQVFGLDWVGVAVVVLLVIIGVLLVFVVFYLRKRAVNRVNNQ